MNCRSILIPKFLLFQIAGLEVNPHPISMLDDLLLFLCIPSFFLYTFLKVGVFRLEQLVPHV